MKETMIIKNLQRGHVDLGWLRSKHTFSFGSYYDPKKNGFGKLLVVNDDVIEGGTGFATHPHGNMEIISIPLKGALAHKDSNGGEGTIQLGEVQVMSAGTGMEHSEFNALQEESTNFLQIWIKPDTRNVEPRYDQRAFPLEESLNTWVNIVAPWDSNEGGLWIHQSAYFDMIKTSNAVEEKTRPRLASNGLFIFVLEGHAEVGNVTLGFRDSLAIPFPKRDTDLKVGPNSIVLKLEVPPNKRGRF